MIRLVVAVLCLLAAPAAAHELRPAYLELTEVATGEYDVVWKKPMRGDLQLSIRPEFSGATAVMAAPVTRAVGDAMVERWRLKAIDPLRGQSLRISGLEKTMTDAVVRIQFADATSWTRRLTPWHPGAAIPARPSPYETALTYSILGVEHILLGIDHLLFVAALLLVVRSRWQLIKTITAFTLAHSITLALATLGVVRVPQQPVEAVIALSIVFVAAEIVRFQRGVPTLASRSPWIVAFTFGLLHGFGFAGALAGIGLPEKQIPVALLFFNIGVEAGQLLFVGTLVGLLAALRRAFRPSWRIVLVPAYGIGTVAMFWVIQRVAMFWSG